MPEEGIHYLPKSALLSYEEMLRLLRVLAALGISKVRITGGEPFVRKDLIPFLYQVRAIAGIEKIHLTTNGVLTANYLQDLKALKINGVNLSLDSLDRERFFQITRRDDFTQVFQTLLFLLENDIPTKINCVVMANRNIADLIPLAELSKNYPLGVRFIEEMPFNGEGIREDKFLWNYRQILAHLENHFGKLSKLSDEANSTSYNYQIPHYQGSVGVIPAFSRTFCGTCNRIRITAQGILKLCLYEDGGMDLRKLLRSGISDADLKETFLTAFRQRPRDGYEAEANRSSPVIESMTTIGG
jgi:cyclic pyranopterin phosphate synthase